LGDVDGRPIQRTLPMKVYFHYEEAEPNFTMKWEQENSTFQDVAQAFASAYNNKFGQNMDASNLAITVDGSTVAQHAKVSSVLSNGEDAYVTHSATSAASSSSSSAAASVPATASAPAPASAPAMSQPLKFYMHWEENPSMTHIFKWTDPVAPLSEALEQFVALYNAQHDKSPLDASRLALHNDSGRKLPLHEPVVKVMSAGADAFVVAADVKDNTPAAVPEGASAIKASQIKAADKSYYYWKKDAAPEERAPIEPPTCRGTRAPKEKELLNYSTISAYSFEDAGTIVKVYISLPDIGKLPKENITFDIAALTFSFKIHGYNGKNLRLQVPKLTDSVDPSRCTYKVSSNTVTIRLQKATDKHWFELHKTKGIGEE